MAAMRARTPADERVTPAKAAAATANMPTLKSKWREVVKAVALPAPKKRCLSFPHAPDQPRQVTADTLFAAPWSQPGPTSASPTGRAAKGRYQPLSPFMRDAILSAVPGLRSFAISLCGNVDRADDLVQETLPRAIDSIHSFQPGTNLSAWMFAILRNLFRSELRKRHREIEDTDGGYLGSLKSAPEQYGRIELEEFRHALAQLSSEQRQALLLVGASGFSYQEAATICEIALGTVKSRVNRARLRLAEILGIDGAEEYGPDQTTRAIMTAGGKG